MPLLPSLRRSSLLIGMIAAVHAVLLTFVAGNLFYLRRNRRCARNSVLPKVSILVPARNEEANLRRLLPSLLRQRYPDFEVIVYDDASEDDSWRVLQAVEDTRLITLRGDGPPPGWIGKVHALYQATRHARGDLFLFLDADAELLDELALLRLVELFKGLPAKSVMTGQTRLLGGGLLLVSLVPNAILSGLPWFLSRKLPIRALGALNGQCWMIEAESYRQHEPHLNLPAEVLEDVQIGRFLKQRDLTPTLVDVQDEVAVHMYEDFRTAWTGFRKNAYLILGGTPPTFVPLISAFALTYLVAPLLSFWFLLSTFVLKRATDRQSRFPLWVSFLAPVSYLLGTVLNLHSAWSHWTGAVHWKGRRVGPS